MRYIWNISWTMSLFKKLFSFLYSRCIYFIFLVTFWCSYCCFIHWHIILLFGCGGRIRTADLQVMSLMSYYFSTPRYLGGGDRDRTCDLLLAKQPLSQLSYTPKILWCPRRDSNSHTFRHWLLRPACLPISPPGHYNITHYESPSKLWA